jgi:hypothetical protein
MVGIAGGVMENAPFMGDMYLALYHI